jgi:hypothetical protein
MFRKTRRQVNADRQEARWWREETSRREESDQHLKQSLEESQKAFDQRLEKSRLEDQRRKEDADRQIQESRKAFDQRMRESDLRFKQGLEESQKAFDQRLEKSRLEDQRKKEEADRQIQESDLRFKQSLAESQEAFDRGMAESRKEHDRILKETAAQVKEASRIVGDLGNKFGELSEYLVVPNMLDKFNALGYVFTKAGRNFKLLDSRTKKTLTEIDILLENGEFVIAVEVKSDLTISYVDQHVERMEKLRRYWDEHNDRRKLLGAVAGAIMEERVKAYAL